MESIKKTILLPLALLVALSLLACGGAGVSLPATQTVGAWQLTLSDAQVTDDLSATRSTVQYSGDVVEDAIQEAPDAGNVFVILKLAVDKTETGAAVFSWDQLAVCDANGNRYARMENDSFLESYGFERLKSTDLTLGENEGYVCFELPKDAAKGRLTLDYGKGTDSCSISIP